jgi:cytoskeletal protein CcmA (bactofilin family)
MENNVDTILGDDIVFRGRLNFKNQLKINGNFKGQITTDGHLIVGPRADVEADIEAGSVSIQGKLRGNIAATTRIDILKSSQITGDLKTPDLQIESGSKFTGSCTMD